MDASAHWRQASRQPSQRSGSSLDTARGLPLAQGHQGSPHSHGHAAAPDIRRVADRAHGDHGIVLCRRRGARRLRRRLWRPRRSGHALRRGRPRRDAGARRLGAPEPGGRSGRPGRGLRRLRRWGCRSGSVRPWRRATRRLGHTLDRRSRKPDDEREGRGADRQAAGDYAERLERTPGSARLLRPCARPRRGRSLAGLELAQRLEDRAHEGAPAPGASDGRG